MLDEKQQMIRANVRRFARTELAPGASWRDQERAFPTAALQKAGELGLMGMTVNEESGGAELDAVSCCLAVMEIAAADGGCSTIISVHNSLVCAPIEKFGTAEQKARYLEPLARGEQLGCFCLSEPGAGSDAAAIISRARQTNDGYSLSGVKQFITSGKNADVALVFAMTDPDAGKKGMTAFIVPTHTNGFQTGKVERTMGQRCSDHCQIILENCRVDRGNILGAPGDGYKIALSTLAGGRLGVASQAVGMARAAFDASLTYAKERRTFGKPIIEHQAIGFRLAEMAAKLSAAEIMVLRAAAIRDCGRAGEMEASMAKLFATEAAERICADAIQIFGGYGYLEDIPVERIYRDVRVCTIYEGSSEIQKIVISRSLAGQDEFRSFV